MADSARELVSFRLREGQEAVKLCDDSMATGPFEAMSQARMRLVW